MKFGLPTKIKQNGMTYDSEDSRCKLFVGTTSATNGNGDLSIAFLTVVDDATNTLKQYFGVFNWDEKDACISQIMKHGGKWPVIVDNI